MHSERYAEFVSPLLNWILHTLETHDSDKRTVSSFNFPRLANYLSKELLDRAKVVITDQIPRPPLSSLGLSEFASFENGPITGITYLDTYFLEPSAAKDESVHCHELIHIIQWRVLGARDFLLLYADGLAGRGYLECPLEMMAYAHQERFDAGERPYSVEAEVRNQTLELLERYR